MAKKGAKKKSKRRHVTHRIKVESVPSQQIIQVPMQKESNTSQVLLENFVSLQRVLTNLSLKVDSLTTQISKLLELFELSAKALAEKDFEIEKENKNMLDRLDKLLDQNKVLARGISLMHERIPAQEQYFPPIQPLQPMPQMPPAQPPQTQGPPQSSSPYIREIQETTRKPIMQQQMFQPSQPPIKKPQNPPQQENQEMPEPPFPEEYQEFESPFEEQ
jgi:hypothetical protein